MMKRILLAAAVLISALGLLSCGSITTTTITIIYDIDETSSSDDSVGYYTIDLEENEDYQDHRDDIKSVDQIGVIAWVYNDGANDVSADLYADTIGTYTTVAEVTGNSTLIFQPAVDVPAADSVLIDWAEGLSYMHNADYVENLVLNGNTITVYVIGDGDTPYDVRVFGQVIITLTVGL